MGKVSSLKGKTQNLKVRKIKFIIILIQIIIFFVLKDKDFGKYTLVKAQNNPPAIITTSLKTYMKYTIESAYLGHNFFWSMAPSANDYILFSLKKPTNIKK